MSGTAFVLAVAAALLVCTGTAGAQNAAVGANLRVTLNAPDTLPHHASGTLQIVTTNEGPDASAADTAVTISLPAGLASGFSHNQGGIGPCSSSLPLTCVLGSIAAGDTRTTTVGLRPDTTGDKVVTAAVSAASFDPAPSDNTASATIHVPAATGDAGVYLLGPSRASVGVSQTYLLNLSNGGPDKIGGVQVFLPIPAELTFGGVSFAGSTTCRLNADGSWWCAGGNPSISCTYPAPATTRTLVCASGALASGGFGTAYLTVTPTTAGTVTSTATLTPIADIDPNPANNAATLVMRTFTGTPPPEADLEITSAATPLTQPGWLLDYDLTVSSHGPDDATSVTVTDTLSPLVEVVSLPAGCSGTTTITCDLGTVPAGNQRFLHLQVRALSVGSAVNTATVTTTVSDLVPANNSTARTTTIRIPNADLSVTATAPATSRLDRPLRATFSVHNDGPDTATGVLLDLTLPPDARPGGVFASNFASCPGTFSSTSPYCTLGSIRSGSTVTVTVDFFPRNIGTASVTGHATGFQSDSTPLTNWATVTTLVTPPPTADLQLTVGAPAVQGLGDVFTYVLTATNNGPDDATGVRIHDTLPEGVLYLGMTFAQGFCAPQGSAGALPGGQFICDLGALARGASTVVTVQVRTVALGAALNTATLSGGQTDPDRTNDYRETLTSVAGGPDTTLVSAPAATSFEQTATFAFSSSPARLRFQCSLDALTFRLCSSGLTYHGLAAGSHTFRVRALDALGNPDPSPASKLWMILGAGAPDTVIYSGPPLTTLSRVAEFAFASNIRGTRFQCALDAGAWRPCSSPLTFHGLPAGPHWLNARAVGFDGQVDPTPSLYVWYGGEALPAFPYGTISASNAFCACSRFSA